MLPSIRLLLLGKKTLAQRIAALFRNGEQGVFFDVSDFATLYQDSAGTTPVTAVEQPVGLILDKSGRGYHASQATSTKRPILKQDASGRYYLLFDGIDDALATGSIDFTGTDKMMVVAGVRKLSDAATGAVLELSANSTSTAGTFSLFAPIFGVSDYQFRSGGSIPAIGKSADGLDAPVTTVITGIASISGDSVNIRANGVFGPPVTTDQGTGNYGNYPLFIGSRAGTSLPFNGHLYSLLIRGALSTDAQIAAAESYVNGKTGAY